MRDGVGRAELECGSGGVFDWIQLGKDCGISLHGFSNISAASARCLCAGKDRRCAIFAKRLPLHLPATFAMSLSVLTTGLPQSVPVLLAEGIGGALSRFFCSGGTSERGNS